MPAAHEPEALAFTVGDEATLDVEVTAESVTAFVALSGDDAPLHTEPTFAQRHGFAGVVVHGALLAAYVSRLVGTKLPGPGSVLQKMELAFRNPCYAPCRLRLTGRVRQVSDATRTVVLDVTVESGSTLLASGKTAHLILAP
jgi:3-hydroxybutyryl-CoA dehydratase